MTVNLLTYFSVVADVVNTRWKHNIVTVILKGYITINLIGSIFKNLTFKLFFVIIHFVL